MPTRVRCCASPTPPTCSVAQPAREHYLTNTTARGNHRQLQCRPSAHHLPRGPGPNDEEVTKSTEAKPMDKLANTKENVLGT